MFSTGQFFSRIILERIREEGGYYYNGKPLPKKDVLKSLRFSGDHWLYDKVIEFTTVNNDALSEYHQKLPAFYSEHGQPMTDEELNGYIYKKDMQKIA